MPPVTKAGGDAFRKEVEFVEKDDAEQRAVGIVMVPDKADLQHDFAREDTIRAFADEFGALMDSGSADGGIMHAAWPSEWMSLERNEVLDEAEDIGGQTAPEGAWVQEWQFDDAGTWDLVADGVYSGYSIGAKAVEWSGPYLIGEDDAVDDVAVPEQLPDDAMVWELTDGVIREVSAVDIPAVPDAEILETKRLGDHLGDRDAFVEEAMERGHTEDDAERMWDNLTRALEEEGAGDPGKESFLERVGKAAMSAVTGKDPVSEKDAGDFEADVFRVVAPEEDAENYEDEVLGIGVDFPNSEVYVDWRNEVFSDELDDPHVSIYGSTSDLEQATGNSIEQMDTLNAKAAKAVFDVPDLQDEQDDKHAAGGDTPDDDGSTTAADDMSDDTDKNTDGDKSLAEQNAEQITELTDAVKSLTEAVDGDSDTDADADKTAEVELPDGSVAEVSKSEVDSWFEDDGDANTDVDGVPATKADIEAVHARLDAISREKAGSQQLDRGSNEGEGGDRLSDLGKALS